MKKAEVSFQLILIVLASLALVIAAFVFVPKTIDTAKDFFNNKLIDFGLKTEEIPTVVIDEERIPEDTKITVEEIPNTKAYTTGYTTIIKEAYGGGWNLDYTLTLNQKDACPLWWPKEECAKAHEPILSNKKLAEVLSSTELHGIIEINGRQYAHTINKEDTSPETPDLLWVRVSEIKDDGTITGTEVSAEEIRNLILADLYEESK